MLISFLACALAANSLPSFSGPSATFQTTYVAPSYLSTPTYDGSGQAVEPQVLYIPKGWNGYQYWMTAAPYAGANDNLENASIWASNDLPGASQHWIVPPGVSNPVIGVPPLETANADQSLFLDSDGTMYLYYDQRKGHLQTEHVISSKDGWMTKTAPKPVTVSDTRLRAALVSTLLADPQTGKYAMWRTYLTSHPITAQFVRMSLDSPTGPVRSTVRCRVTGIPQGQEIWEQNMVAAPNGQIYALVTLANYGTNGTGTSLHFMSSSDEGYTWTLDPRPAIPLGAPGSWDDRQIYRGCIQPTAATLAGTDNHYDIWYSAANQPLVWHIAYAQGQIISGSR